MIPSIHACAGRLLLTGALIALPTLMHAGSTKSGVQAPLKVLGWVENVYLVEPGFEVKAKLDSGARTSSLDVRIIKKFRQYGKRWVRFAVRHPETGKETVMVRERERTIGIVQHEGETDVRPTVKIEVCFAGARRRIEVSLTDRSNFEYPMLLGRRALRKVALIHPGQTFLASEPCGAHSAGNAAPKEPAGDDAP